MHLFDVHAHLTHPTLLADLAGVLQRAKQANVTTMICNGLNLKDNLATLRLADKYPEIKPALGFYPVDTVLQEMQELGIEYHRDSNDPIDTPQETLQWLRQNGHKAFAIGEIGLDGYWVPESLWLKQEEIFIELVQIAIDLDKPIIIHTRKREKRALEILKTMPIKKVNWHCFGSKLKLAEQIADCGHYFSIPANARRSESFTRMLQHLPREQLMLETDCPYLGPDKDKFNEPANVKVTAEYAAELWQTTLEETTQQFSKNFHTFFGQAA